MRRKKHKKTRRAVVFYKLNYGFHEPYKVLVDGNFIHATMATSLSDLDAHVSSLLGARIKLYVTRCVTHELKQLGDEFTQACRAAKKYELHKCDHTPGECTPATCIRQAIGSSNDDRWWVATQDQTLRSELEQIPGCPLIFATINGIHLHEPSGLTKQMVQQVHTSHQAVPSHEKASTALLGIDELREGIKTTVKFRKHKIKGPNPLSVKKKKAKPTQQQTGLDKKKSSGGDDSGGGDGDGGGGDGGGDGGGAKKRMQPDGEGGGGEVHEANQNGDEGGVGHKKKRKRKRTHKEDPGGGKGQGGGGEAQD